MDSEGRQGELADFLGPGPAIPPTGANAASFCAYRGTSDEGFPFRQIFFECILTQFATVDEVKAGLPKIKVNRAPLAAFNGPLPIHVTVHDAAGNSIAIEYVGGQLQIIDKADAGLSLRARRNPRQNK